MRKNFVAAVVFSSLLLSFSPIAGAVSVTNDSLARVPNVPHKKVSASNEAMQPINMEAPQMPERRGGGMIQFPNTPIESWPLWMRVMYENHWF